MASKTPDSRSMVVASTSSAAVEICRWVLSKLEANDFSRNDIFAVHLALDEAFLNAIQHGNEMDPDKEVRIAYSVGLDKIEISMTDEGKGFDPDVVPDPRYGENIYKTKGRGLFLMRSYMDVVEYNKVGNSVRMVKYKEKQRLTEAKTQA